MCYSAVYSGVYSAVPPEDWAETGQRLAVGRDYGEIDETIGTLYFIELGQGYLMIDHYASVQ